ncbi:conserved hypothetical protein [Candida tropicalis MYA-3404]|uniref:Uncharacterized protein n=1 Tax=Candida tropicalis (strain ATCC MYA-3404 / T1) TaxID=294747 RepID=C5MJH8_CANTT|nr:conserved hypothetical protein [Candida tropicalis MYA-3404]EER30181.1 conserved hypothetical protein [Candida tropicalis MYA-3404]KAG4404131.1 hypothetical protein JTP64_001363 [Candida tropicalis]
MIANSTHISSRMFRSQKLMMLSILAAFLVLLGITGISGHHHQVIATVKSASNKASDTIAGIYNEYALTPEQEEIAEEAKIDAEKLSELDAEKQAEVNEEKQAKEQENLEDEQIKQEDEGSEHIVS